jgi:hypothetical protein
VESLHAADSIAVIASSLRLRPLLPAESIIFAVQLLALMARQLVKTRVEQRKMHEVSVKLLVANLLAINKVMQQVIPLVGHFSGDGGVASVSVLLPCLRLCNLCLEYEQSSTKAARRASTELLSKLSHHRHQESQDTWHMSLLVQLHTVCSVFDEFCHGKGTKVEYFDSDEEDENEEVGHEKLESLGSEAMKLLRVRVTVLVAVSRFLPLLKPKKVLLNMVDARGPRRTRIKQLVAVTLLLFKYSQRQVRNINADGQLQSNDEDAMGLLRKAATSIEGVFRAIMDVLLDLCPGQLCPRPTRKTHRRTPNEDAEQQEEQEEQEREQEEWEMQYELSYQIVSTCSDYLRARCSCAPNGSGPNPGFGESDSFPLPVPILFRCFRVSLAKACAVLAKAAHQEPGVKGGLLCGRSWIAGGGYMEGGGRYSRNSDDEVSTTAMIHKQHGHPLAVRTIEALLLTLRVANSHLFDQHGGSEAMGINPGASASDGSAMGFMMPTVHLDLAKHSVESHAKTRSVVLSVLGAIHELVLAVDIDLDPPGSASGSTAPSPPCSSRQNSGVQRMVGSGGGEEVSVDDLLDDAELENMELHQRFASKHHHLRTGMTAKEARKRRTGDAVKASMRDTRIHCNRCCASLQALGVVRAFTECMRISLIDEEVLVAIYKPLRITSTTNELVEQFYAHAGTSLIVCALHKHRSDVLHTRHAMELVARLIDVGYIELVVQVMCAMDLPLADINKKGQAMPADPYAMVHWNDEMLGRSKTINDSSHPTWVGNNAFTVRMPLCPSLGSSTLRIEVRDYDPEDSVGDLLGEVAIKGADMQRLMNEQQHRGSTSAADYGRNGRAGPAAGGAGVPEGNGCFFAELQLKKKKHCTELQKVRGSLGVRWWPSADGLALFATVVNARGLANLDKGADKSDPFCMVFFNGIKVGTTRHIADNLSPQWDETFRVPLKPDLPSSLCVEVRDFDGKGKTGAFLGQIRINGAEMQRHASTPDWPRYYSMQKNWDSNEDQPLVKGSIGVALTCITPTIVISLMRHFHKDVATQRACVWVMSQLGKKPRNMLDTVKAGGIFALVSAHRHFLPLALGANDAWVKVREVGGAHKKDPTDELIGSGTKAPESEGTLGVFGGGEMLGAEEVLEREERKRVDACVLVNAIETTLCKMLHTSSRFFRFILQHQHLQKSRGATSVNWLQPLMDRGVIPRNAPDSFALHAEGRRQIHEVNLQKAEGE